jgi:hypothetical protein
MAQSPPEERVIETRIPTHLPLKIKMKNVLKVKDLKNKKWMHDLEVEVTNTGDKPIYHFLILVFMPEVIGPLGVPYVYNLAYGRLELHDLMRKALPEDMPLNPGESCTLKIPEEDWRGWESAISTGEAVNPIKVRLLFGGLNYGDGTGFSTTDGHPYPRKASSCRPPVKDSEVGTNTMADPGISTYAFLQLAPSFLPVNFLLANFLPTFKSSSGKTASQSGLC